MADAELPPVREALCNHPDLPPEAAHATCPRATAHLSTTKIIIGGVPDPAMRSGVWRTATGVAENVSLNARRGDAPEGGASTHGGLGGL